MKQKLFILLMILGLASCNDGGVNSEYDAYKQWVDSIGNEDINLSFKNIRISSMYGNKNYNTRKEDTICICFSNQGKMMKDDNVHYTISTFKGRVYNILIETDNDDTYEFIQNIYLKRIGCDIKTAKDLLDLREPDMSSDEQHSSMCTYNYKNGALEFYSKNNTKKYLVGIDKYRYTNRDTRFNNSSIYCISMTDSTIYYQYMAYKNKMQKIKIVKEKAEKEKQKRELNNKDEQVNSKLQNQF